MSRPFPAFLAALSLLGLSSLACSADDGGGPLVQAGGSANAGGGAGSGGGAGIVDLSKGGPKLRILTQSEYRNSLTHLLGSLTQELDLPPDTFIAGYTSIGGAEIALNPTTVEQYEKASRAAVAEVFADAARWQTLVGCVPQVDLSDACVVSFIQSFGKRAFRRDLTDAEVHPWLQVGKDVALLSASAAQGLAAVVSGLLQSPYFLYRVEINKLDASNGRLKYEGLSMATRLAYLLTGSPPNDALLTAAAAGQLDTADGLKTAAAPLLNDPSAVDRMAIFFNEFSRSDLVLVVEKSPAMFPSWNPALQSSMLQATQLFIKNVVLAPNADVRSFFNSDQTFVDATLAPIYDTAAPASGFAQLTLGPATGRAGILGQAGVLAGHSQVDHNSPTRRGVFITETFLCQSPPSPPDGVITTLPDDPTLTTREKLKLHGTSPACSGCHLLFDPAGLALEHFDSIGKYQPTENGLTIDTTGTIDGIAFDGGAQLGAALAQSPRALTCMMSNFYRSATGRKDASEDSAVVDTLAQSLTAKGYLWRDLLAEFVVSDAFRSAPAAVVTAGNQ